MGSRGGGGAVGCEGEPNLLRRADLSILVGMREEGREGWGVGGEAQREGRRSVEAEEQRRHGGGGRMKRMKTSAGVRF